MSRVSKAFYIIWLCIFAGLLFTGKLSSSGIVIFAFISLFLLVILLKSRN